MCRMPHTFVTLHNKQSICINRTHTAKQVTSITCQLLLILVKLVILPFLFVNCTSESQNIANSRKSVKIWWIKTISSMKHINTVPKLNETATKKHIFRARGHSFHKIIKSVICWMDVQVAAGRSQAASQSLYSTNKSTKINRCCPCQYARRQNISI